MWHKHKWELVGFTICSSGLVATLGYCFDVYKCKKCGRLKVGDYRKMTEQECRAMADDYKKIVSLQ